MSDRSAHTLIIHDCPPELVRVFRAVIAEFDLTDGGDDTGDDRITLDTAYVAGGHPCGGSSEIAGYLEEHAPGSTWTVWEDPAYEWLGNVYRHAPELGTWSAESDADGNGVFHEDEIRRAIRTNTVDEMLGTAWVDRIAALTKEHAGREVITVIP